MFYSLERFDIVLVDLHHAYGAEMRKVRPCVIISPNALHYLKTCIIAPLTSTHHDFSTRIPTYFHDFKGEIALDQLRAIDLHRILHKLGTLDPKEQADLLEGLQKLFSI